jgi:hypothetical protein
VDERLTASQEGFGTIKVVQLILEDSNLESCEECSKSEPLKARQQHELVTTT